MAPPEQRGRAITFVFLGWSLASVLGMPIARLARRDLRLALRLRAVALLVAGSARLGVSRRMPDGVQAGGAVAGAPGARPSRTRC